jgi:hypothetical protein
MEANLIPPKFLDVLIFILLCSSIFTIPLINAYFVYAEEPQSNASNTDNIASQLDLNSNPNADGSNSNPNASGQSTQ